jgi:hypothetical protein
VLLAPLATPARSQDTWTRGDEDGLELGPWTFSGSALQTYRYRHSTGGSDQDLHGSFDLSGETPARNPDGSPAHPRWSFELQASYDLDIDSFERAEDVESGDEEPFLETTNTFGDRLRGFLHAAYLDATDLAVLDLARLGRQSVFREETVYFDGGYLRCESWRGLSLDAWGGLPVRFYESSAAGDAVAGTGLEWRPVRPLVLGADYVFSSDAREGFADAEDHVSIVRGDWCPTREWTLRASGSWIDDRDRRQLLEARYLSETSGFLGRLRLLRQGEVVEFQSDEFSPFVIVEGEYAPFYEALLDLHQPLGKRFGLGGGAHARELEDEGNEGLYNRSFVNAFLSLEASELWKGMRASARGDAWDADGEEITTAGFELEQRVLELLRVRIGTSYSLYRIDPFTGSERHRDRIYYARLRWHAAKHLDIDAGYQYEKDSVTEYHTVTTGLRTWF